MSEKLHTPEPWGVDFNNTYKGKPHYMVGVPGERLCVALTGIVGAGDDEESKANARRIVACVNALEGVATDRLETANISGSGFWGKCIHDADVKYSELAIQNKELTAQRDELLAALTHAATDYIDQNGSVPSWWTEKIRQMVKDGKK